MLAQVRGSDLAVSCCVATLLLGQPALQKRAVVHVLVVGREAFCVHKEHGPDSSKGILLAAV
jgi:hypothetical protein